jgi:GAF domain-containing protein
MKLSGELAHEVTELRQRLTRLAEASLRINESLDFDTVLQGVLDSARSLTNARYGVMTLHGDGDRVQNFLSSGMESEEAGKLWAMHGGLQLYEYLGNISGPMRLGDLVGHIRSLGLPELPPPVAEGPVVPYLASPVMHRGERVGNIYLAGKWAKESSPRKTRRLL